MWYLSVMLIFKNETLNLRTWMEHYLWQGVQHFFLIDNGSTDNPLTILTPYIERGLVTYVYKPAPYLQVAHYRSTYDECDIRNKTQWLLVCDSDEFVYGIHGPLIKAVHHVDKRLHKNAIYLHWFSFGNGGVQAHPLDIRTTFVRRQPMDPIHTKYIVRTAAMTGGSSQLSVHTLVESHTQRAIPATDRTNIICADDIIHCNHYVVQSVEWYQTVKARRGDSASESNNGKCSEQFFEEAERLSTETDTTLRDLVVLWGNEQTKRW